MSRTIHEAFFLYVEDDATNRKVMRLLMERVLGTAHYAIFEDSTDFMARLKDLPRVPDVILLDIHLKPLDGFAILRLLRADPIYHDTLVLAVTASIMNDEVNDLRASGFDGAIGKPLSLQQFPGQLVSALAGDPVWDIA